LITKNGAVEQRSKNLFLRGSRLDRGDRFLQSRRGTCGLAILAQCRPNLSQNFLHHALTQRRHLTLNHLRNGVSD
jgi:hypothetical protein